MTRTPKKYVSPSEPEKYEAALRVSQKAKSPKTLAQNAKKDTKEDIK